MSALDGLFLLAGVAALAAPAALLLPGGPAARRGVPVAVAGMAGLFATLGALPVAVVLAAVATAAAVLPIGRSAGDEDGDDGAAGVVRGARAALLVGAFFALAARALLMVRWPIEAEAGPGLDWAGLPHVLVVALALFCIGAFAAITRGRAVQVAAAMAWMGTAAALVVVAVAAFVGGRDDAEWLAFVVITISAMGVLVADHFGSSPRGAVVEEEALGRAGRTLAGVLALVTAVLFVGAW